MRDLAALPKAHLHLHLEGGMRPSTLHELAARYGMEVPTVRGFGSFTAFADMYVAACQVLGTPEAMTRLAEWASLVQMPSTLISATAHSRWSSAGAE